MTSTNTLRRPGKPVQTFLGPILEVGSQAGFYFYQAATNPTAMIWFAQPDKKLASRFRNQMLKQPKTHSISSMDLLGAIKSAVAEGAAFDLDAVHGEEETEPSLEDLDV